MVKFEKRSIEQPHIPFCPSGSGIGIRRRLRHRDPIIQMKFARSAIIIQPIGNVGILLHLNQSDARADRMDGSCRDVEEVPRLHRLPVHQLLNLARKRRGTQFIS